MQTFKIEYIPHLADFLDETKTPWANLGNNKVSISVKSAKDAFILAIEFEKWKSKYNL